VRAFERQGPDFPPVRAVERRTRPKGGKAMAFRPMLAAAAAVLLILAPASAGAQPEIDLGDDFDIDLEEPTSPPEPPWKLAKTRDGLIAQEAALETEIEAIDKLLRAANQRNWLWPRVKGATRAADYEIRNAERAARLLDAGVQSGEWSSAQASQLRARFEEENARAVSRLRVRQVNFQRRLKDVKLALGSR